MPKIFVSFAIVQKASIKQLTNYDFFVSLFPIHLNSPKAICIRSVTKMSYDTGCGYSACSSCGYSTSPNADYSASHREYNSTKAPIDYNLE